MTTTEKDQLIAFRKETKEWLDANCPQSMRQPVKDAMDYYAGGKTGTFKNDDQKKWFEVMRDKGWTVPHWPKQYGGGGLSKAEYSILKDEMMKMKCRTPLFSFGISMLGPALLKFATEEQKMEHLPKIAKGEIRWCQGYSEPNAGSDLASLQTKAVDNGDHFLVSGQKVWTSYADQSDWIFCLVRTDTEAPKHKGISFVLIDMGQEGVTARPIKLISGKSPFCETFFDNAVVPKSNLIGVRNEGWNIAKYLLTHEREMIGSLFGSSNDQPVHEAAIESIGLTNGILSNSALRTDIARFSIDKAAFQLTLGRVLDEIKSGQSLGAASSILKYYGTELNKQRMELMLSLGGFQGLEWEGVDDGRLSRSFLRTKGNSIEGGTSEVQLNIIAQRILGLPKR